MLGNWAIDSLVAAVVLAGWYLWFRRANQHRAAQILRWIREGVSNQGSVSKVRWHGSSRFDVELKLCPSIFRSASITVQMCPREMPLNWLVSRVRKQREIVTFEAKLDQRPNFNLQILNHRWYGKTRRVKTKSLESWQCLSLEPFMISNRSAGEPDVAPVLEALLAARSCDILRVAFHKRAPHFVAWAYLQSLCPGAEDSQVFDVLQELASCVSHSAH